MANIAHAFNEENIKYLRGFLGEDKVKIFIRLKVSDGKEASSEAEQKAYQLVNNCLEKMDEFGENHWWESTNPNIRGYYQLNCKTLLISFDDFHKSLEYLLDRPVWTYEFAINYDEIKKEAERAFKAREVSKE